MPLHRRRAAVSPANDASSSSNACLSQIARVKAVSESSVDRSEQFAIATGTSPDVLSQKNWWRVAFDGNGIIYKHAFEGIMPKRLEYSYRCGRAGLLDEGHWRES